MTGGRSKMNEFANFKTSNLPKFKAQALRLPKMLKTATKKKFGLSSAHISFPSGACIPLANKCNSKIDCFEDESDESHCSYLEV